MPLKLLQDGRPGCGFRPVVVNIVTPANVAGRGRASATCSQSPLGLSNIYASALPSVSLRDSLIVTKTYRSMGLQLVLEMQLVSTGLDIHVWTLNTEVGPATDVVLPLATRKKSDSILKGSVTVGCPAKLFKLGQPHWKTHEFHHVLLRSAVRAEVIGSIEGAGTHCRAHASMSRGPKELTLGRSSTTLCSVLLASLASDQFK